MKNLLIAVLMLFALASLGQAQGNKSGFTTRGVMIQSLSVKDSTSDTLTVDLSSYKYFSVYLVVDTLAKADLTFLFTNKSQSGTRTHGIAYVDSLINTADTTGVAKNIDLRTLTPLVARAPTGVDQMRLIYARRTSGNIPLGSANRACQVFITGEHYQ